MTVQYDEGKPSLDELAHYGVMGMKWGKTRAKATGTEIYRARRRVQNQQNDLINKKQDVKKTGKGKGELAKMQASFLKNPDRVTASRLTRGEKAAALLLSIPSGGLAGLAVIGATSAVSRRIEKKQDDGAYNKKK